MRTQLALLAAFLLVSAPASAQPAVPPASKCTALKYKAAAVHVERFAACKVKARRTGAEEDPACVDKAEAKLHSDFARAERKGDCVTTIDAVQIVVESYQFMTSLTARLDRRRLCCEVEDNDLCFYAADAGDCLQFDGVLGSEGSVCQPSGNCEAGPELAAPCCDAASLGYDVSCVMSPTYVQTNCAATGGVFSPNALCSQEVGCAPVP
jgi:hypothetical protein